MSQVNRESMPTGLRVRMFGQFHIEIDGETLQPHRPTDLRMLAYLLLQHDCPVERIVVAELWKPEKSSALWEAKARTYLARSVSEMTSRLGRHGKRLQKPQAQILIFDTTDAEMDLLEWETALADGSIEALEKIAPLYRTPLLEGWEDAWVQRARARIQNDYLLELRASARRETVAKRWNAALTAYTLLAAIDPWHEETLRDHLQLLADRRRPTQMQKLYDGYVKHCDAIRKPIDAKTLQRYRDLRAALAQPAYHSEEGCLPAPLSRFIPRPADVREISVQIRAERLTTLTGTGGIGKTRLAIAVAEATREEYYDGVWFIDLSDIQDPTQTLTKAARSLRLDENGNQSAMEAMLSFLRSREALIILDNCEHVLEESARLAAYLLENCPRVKLLATSRETLGIVGESVWSVPSLSYPDRETQVLPQKLATFSAVRLLIARASRPQSPLLIDAENADAVARICRRLAGIPLAIELAAVQITRRSRSVQEVAESVEEALSFLNEGSSVAPSRQQTLHAAVEWSYRLLSHAEQQVFERLGVFVGGCTEDAAVALCADLCLHRADIVRIVKALVDKSLVDRMSPDEEPRFHLLPSIREYALERLVLSQTEEPEPTHEADPWADNLAHASRRHLRFFTDFAVEAERHRTSPDQAVWLDRQGRDHDNFRAALTWALRNGENETGLLLAGSLAPYLYTRGYHAEAASWLTEFLDRAPEATPPIRAVGLQWAGNLAYSRTDYAQAHVYFTEYLALRERGGDLRNIALAKSSLATATGGLGQHREALALFEETLPIFEQLNDTRNMAMCWTSIALQHEGLEAYIEVRDAHANSLALFRKCGDLANVGLAASNLVGVQIQLWDYAAARTLLAECITLYRKLQSRHRMVFILVHYLCLATREQKFDRAATILGFKSAYRERIGYTLPPKIARLCLVEETACRQGIEDARFEARFALGMRLPEDEMIELLLEN